MTPRASESRGGPRSPRTDRAERAHDAWGAVFCGGRSARMGRDKARLAFGDVTLVERAAAVLAEVAPRVLLACGTDARYPELGLEPVLDEGDGSGGPLAGLAAVLARLAEAPGVAYACVLACDMPRADAAVFRGLLARARAADADACLVATAAGPEPLCAVVHGRCLPAVRAALARGERRMIAFHPGLSVVHVAEPELAPGCAANVNTPEEYAAALDARKGAACQGGAS